MMKTSATQSFEFGLIGYPLGHSVSAYIHRAALDFLKLQGNYINYEIPPSGDYYLPIKSLLHQLRIGNIHGLNITIPYKSTVLELLDDLTPQARQIGAVNTLYQKNGQVIGDNTDVGGFLKDFKELLSSAEQSANPANALVLGGGGAARAVVYGLLQEGWNITLATRNPEQAQVIVEKWRNQVRPSQQIQSLQFSELKSSTLRDIQAIINATPLGMWPAVESSPWPNGIPFPKSAVIYDLVYNPIETSLTRAARSQGLSTKTGGGMLVEQAALAFEKWTGYEAPRTAMYQAFKIAIEAFEPQNHPGETEEI